MVIERNLSVGLRCKACDAGLGNGDFDPELCATCYIASTGLWKEDKDDDLIMLERDENFQPLPQLAEDW